MQPSYKMVDEKTGRYLPFIYPEELPFWEAVKARQVKLQRCSECRKAWYPIGASCPHCFSRKFEWEVMSGRGTLHNFVVYHKAFTKWFESRVPYAVVQVQLEEGPRLTTNLIDCPIKDIKIGMRVEAAYEDITPDITLLQFKPSQR